MSPSGQYEECYYGRNHQDTMRHLRERFRDAFRTLPTAPYFVLKDDGEVDACQSVEQVVEAVSPCRFASVICAGVA